MTRTFISSLASLALASAVVAAQGTAPRQTPPTAPQIPAVEEVTLTGCLIQGSGPAVFIFADAKFDKQTTTEKGKTYVLSVGKDDVAFVNHLNHKVTIQGSAETKVAPIAPPGQQVHENDLPKLTVQGVTMVAATCTVPK
jgi:hypothetical protein